MKNVEGHAEGGSARSKSARLPHFDCRLAAGLGAGRKMTCYENVRFEVAQCGGRWIDQASVVDGKLITAQTWESHPDFYRNIFAHLK